MVRLLSLGIECFSSLVFIIPAIIIARFTLFKKNSISKVFMIFIFAFYSMAVFSVVGVPTVYTLRVDFSINLIPLIDIFNSPLEYIKNTVLNIILFIPMGFLLPVIWKEYRSIKKTILMGLAVSIMIELLQIFTFRLTDIDDLITNTSGTFLGYYCREKMLLRLPLKKIENDEAASMKYEPVIILVVTFLIAFFLKPFISNKIWDMILTSSLWESIK